jgi:hypothetical protein
MQTQVPNSDGSPARPSRSPYRAVIVLFACTFIFILLHGHTAVTADCHTSTVSRPLALPARGVRFGNSTQHDHGSYPAIAMNASGLVVEVDEPYGKLKAIEYRVGQVNGSSVTWGNRYEVPLDLNQGYRPSVALTKSGQVIIVWSYFPNRSNPNHLYYKVGQLDAKGGSNQQILWLTKTQFWDTGFNASVSVNDNGLIVGVHESGTGGNGLYYKIGEFANPPLSYHIKWTSREYGIKYTSGVNPRVAINNENQVVEVHQVQASENLLHYIRGTVSAPFRNIAFAGDQPRYQSNASTPTVALLDSGLVIEAHVENDKLGAMVGQLSGSDAIGVNWSSSVTFDPPVTDQLDPQVAAIGNRAILFTGGNYLKNNWGVFHHVALF